MITSVPPENHCMIRWEFANGRAFNIECYCGFIAETTAEMQKHCVEANRISSEAVPASSSRES